MALSAVPPGAALRVMRGVVGRRALQVVLLVGGLLLLGLLCGEQAHAVDGVVPAKKPAELAREVTGSAERLTAGTPRKWAGEQSPGSGSGLGSDSRPAIDEVQRVVRPVTEEVVRPVTERVIPPTVGHVVQPIGDLVDQITDEIGEGIGGGIVDGIGDGIDDGVVERPAPPQWWPSVPQLPTLPGVPELPESPGLPLPAVPGETLPAESTVEPQQPGGASDQQQAVEKKSSGENSATVYGPRFAGGLATTGDDVRHQGHARSARDSQMTAAVQAPVHQVPDGDPTGALARHSAVDNGSPRHGDAQAVTLNERARPTLVPSAAADVAAAGPRDRHRDIPASPG
ncbi:hypothetical protein ACIOKD_04460 [Streptomyces sp. NPDC087844]|uniref:hypothetical protein n=1 Tax=Streptomyces sp. NPDC087844 TaxID=3365805 RepID=UPI00380DD0D1